MALTVEDQTGGSPALRPERRRAIFLLPLVSALPVIVFAVSVFAYLSQAQQRALEGEILQLARYSSQAGDLLLEERVSTLHALASLAVDRDVSDFARQARLILMTRPDWRGITLRTAKGELLAAETRPGEPPPRPVVDLNDSVKPWPSAMVLEPPGEAPLLLVRTRAARPGGESHVITARLDLEPFSHALAGLTGESWTLALLDGQKVIAGRSRDPERYVGKEATPSLGQEIDAAQERFFYALNQEGERVYTAFSTSPRTGWTAAIGAPAQLVEAPLRRAQIAWIAGGLAAVALAGFLAWLLTHSILTRQAAERKAWQLESEREAEARLTEIATHFPGVMYRRIFHPDGTISYPYVSPGAADLLGASPDELFRRRPIEELARDRIAPEDRAAFVAALERSAAAVEPFNVEVRSIRNDGGHAWIRSTASTRRAPDGTVIWDGVMTDVTPLKDSEDKLRARTEALRAISQVNATIASELDRDTLVQSVLDAGRGMVGAAWGAFFYNVADNTGGDMTLYKISGARPEDFADYPMPRSTMIFGPTMSGEGIIRSDDITRDPRYGHNAPHSGMPEGHLPVRSYIAAPVVSRAGKVLGGLFFGHPAAGIFDEGAEEILSGLAAQAAVALENARLFKAAEDEIAQRREAEARQRMLLAELNHRVKNTLAVVLAIAQQTAKTSSGLPQFAEVFQGRIQALANAHTLLTAGSWRSTTLKALVETALEPHAEPGSERVTVGGPEVIVPPRQALALSLVLHEMATNASKYGGLSAAGAGLSVTWSPGDEDVLLVCWRERTQHPVTAPEREGFGSRLITMNVARELGGGISREFGAEGFTAELRLPWHPATRELASADEGGGDVPRAVGSMG